MTEIDKRIHVRLPNTPRMRDALHRVTDMMYDHTTVGDTQTAIIHAIKLALEPEQMEVEPPPRKGTELTLREVQQWLQDEEASLHISYRASRDGKRKLFVVAVGEVDHKSSEVKTDNLEHGLKTVIADF